MIIVAHQVFFTINNLITLIYSICFVNNDNSSLVSDVRHYVSIAKFLVSVLHTLLVFAHWRGTESHTVDVFFP